MTELWEQEDKGCPGVGESGTGREGDCSASSQPVSFDGRDWGVLEAQAVSLAGVMGSSLSNSLWPHCC